MKLTLNNYGKFDTKQIFNNKRAVIDIEHDYRFFNLVAVVSYDNDYSRIIKIADNQLILPQDILKVGRLYLKIKVMTGNDVVKVIPCESILVKELNKDIELIPQVVECSEKVANLELSIQKVLKVVNALCNINLVLNTDGTLEGEGNE